MALMLLIAGVCDGMSGTFTDGFRMVMGENDDFRWLISQQRYLLGVSSFRKSYLNVQFI